MIPALAVQQPGLGVVTADNLNTYVQGGALLSNLQAFIGVAGMIVYTTGYSAVGDGGQGAWTWNAGLTSGDNLSTVLPNGSVQGGWQKLNVGTLPPGTAIVNYAGVNESGLLIADYGTGFGVGLVFQAVNTANCTTVSIESSTAQQVGSITQTSTTTAFNTTSDRRLKRKIRSTERGLETLMRISARDFEFAAEPGRTVQGFIAQDLHAVYPEAVTVGGDDPKTEPWSVDYGRLTPLLVRAVHELKEQVDALRARLGE